MIAVHWSFTPSSFSVALRPQKPSGLLGTGAQDSHFNFHTAPLLQDSFLFICLSMDHFQVVAFWVNNSNLASHLHKVIFIIIYFYVTEMAVFGFTATTLVSFTLLSLPGTLSEEGQCLLHCCLCQELCQRKVSVFSELSMIMIFIFILKGELV